MKHLFVDFPCPHCGERIAIALDILRRKARFQCTECHETATAWLGEKELNLFAQSFDQLYKQLQSIGLEVMFFSEPTATIWKQDDKPQAYTSPPPCIKYITPIKF